MILVALCLCVGLGATAQRDNSSRDNNRRSRQPMDAVVDTAVLNRMNLETKMMDEILALQKAKLAARQEMMKGARPEKGKKMDDAARQAMRTQQATFTADYRAELRAIMGDPLYISYLERQVDSRPAMRMSPQRRTSDFGGDGRRGGMGGRDGGFDGGDF